MQVTTGFNVTDEALVAAIRHDDRKALGELYNRYYKKVFNKCFSFTRKQEEAFDLAQESLIKAFDNIHSFNNFSKNNMFPIKPACHNLPINIVRKEKGVGKVQW